MVPTERRRADELEPGDVLVRPFRTVIGRVEQGEHTVTFHPEPAAEPRWRASVSYPVDWPVRIEKRSAEAGTLSDEETTA